MHIKTADKIKKDLMEWSRSSGYDIIIPNFYLGRYEMDLFRLTPAGLITEYEIKVSRADYKADFYKEQAGCNNKHALMTGGTCACNRFYFVVPKKMVRAEEVPSYAGLLYYKGKRGFDLVKNAPLIHKQKQSPEIYKELALSLSFREQVLRNRIVELRKKIRKLSVQS